MAKKLTPDGIDEVEEREYSSPTPPQPSTPEQPSRPNPIAQPARRDYPQTSQVIIVKREPPKKFWMFFSISMAIILLIIASFVWFNISFSKKDFAPKVTVEPATVQVPVSVNNNYTIENKVNNNGTYILQLPKELSDALVRVLNQTIKNCTNCT